MLISGRSGVPVRGAGVRRTALVALLVGVLAGSAQADTSRFYGTVWSYKKGTSCTKPNREDPIGVFFHGTAATMDVIGSTIGATSPHGNLEYHMNRYDGRGWADNTAGTAPQNYQSFGSCNPSTAALSTPFWDVGNGARRRFHVRMWQQVNCPEGRCQVAAAPHVDEQTNDCSGDHSPASVALPYGGRGTGFDWAREEVKAAYLGNPHYEVRDEFWGNIKTVYYCGGGGKTKSGGWTTLISVGNR